MVSEVYDVIDNPLIFVHAGILYKPWYNEDMVYCKKKTTTHTKKHIIINQPKIKHIRKKTHNKLRYNQRWDISHISFHQKQIHSG